MAEEVIGLLFGVDGGGAIDGRSGQQIVSDLTKIVNQINSGKSTVPKVQLKFDTSNVKTALQELKAQLREIAGMGSISVSGMPSRGGSGGSAGVKQDTANYRALTTTVKQYYAALAEVEKIQMKSTAVSSLDGVWTTTDAQYDARIQKINQLKMDFDKLGVIVDDVGDVEMHSAQQLNITEEQRAMLLTQVQSAITANGLAHEKSAAQISAAWDKNADKATQYVRRIEDVASKNADVKESMDKVLKLAASGDPKNLDDLTKEFAKLQQKVRATEADVKTWGDRFKKTFGNEVRSVLAATLVAVATKYLREVYTNVVNLDKALVNLQIASGKTREETKELVKEYADLAKTLGATTAEVADAADTWLRQGYSTEEANMLITNSMMLSKLGQMESAEASKALTSAMKGYGVAVEDSVQIVDKLTKVDMEAAASAGDIATAMAETAASADLSGVSMDKLIGYLTVVKEVTQDGAESVGTFYRTLFARMNNVAAGKFIDDETGEALNDVEAVLGELNISLRDTNDSFRDTDEVLDEVANRWDEFTNKERHAIATAIAGTRQQEKFLVLMQNYDTALRYATSSTEAVGTATEKFSAYTEGIEGKMNALKAAFEKFSVAFLDSDLVVGAIEFFTLIMNGIAGVASFIDSIGGLPTVLLAVASALLLVNGGLIAYNAQMKITAAYQAILLFFTKLKTGLMSIVHAIPNAIVAWKAYAAGTVSASTAMQASIPVIGLILAAVTALAGVLSLASGAQDDAAQKTKEAASAAAELSDNITSLTNEYLYLSDEVKTNVGVSEELASVQDKLRKEFNLTKGELDDLIKKYGSATVAAREYAIQSLQTSERDLRPAVTDAKDTLVKDGKKAFNDGYAVDVYKSVPVNYKHGMQGQVDTRTAIKTLVEAGYDVLDSAYVTNKNGQEYSGVFSYDLDYDLTSATGLLSAYNELGTMLDIVGDEVGQNNLAYEALYSKYSALTSAVTAYKEAIDALNANLAEQYVLQNMGDELPKTQAEFDAYRQVVIDSAISSGEFAGTQEDIVRSIDKILEQSGSFTDFYKVTTGAAQGATVALKSAYDVLSEVQGGYDGLASALTDVTSEGYLTADALSTLFKLEKDKALAGLKLADILTQDANGYKLAGNALQQYVQALIAANTIEGAFATQKDKENAIANLETLQAVLATLAATQNESTDASKARREELEKEQDMYQDQLDKFEELTDLRKDLLQTYKEELDYQKELEKRQRNVTTLQTRLSVARLDQSAAGQARVRELEAELKEAQEDLDDFTLEHAIDVITDQLDSANSEWKAIIQGKLNEIASILESLDTTPEVNVTTDTSWVQGAISQIGELIDSINQGEVGGLDDLNGDTTTIIDGSKEAARKAAQDYIDSHGMLEGDKERWGQDPNFLRLLRAYIATGGSINDLVGKARIYHAGGIVGDISHLSSTEEFAKLLKGEFVSTPAQMKRFMEETLPRIANYSASGSSNEFNAPLIEITCESVTTEALPELERVVDEAVREIKKQLDSGMNRVGHKKTAKKLLI